MTCGIFYICEAKLAHILFRIIAFNFISMKNGKKMGKRREQKETIEMPTQNTSSERKTSMRWNLKWKISQSAFEIEAKTRKIYVGDCVKCLNFTFY